jgi:hypothetical protein
MWKTLGVFLIGAFCGIPILKWLWSEAQKHAASALQSATTSNLQQNATHYITTHIASYLAQAVK